MRVREYDSWKEFRSAVVDFFERPTELQRMWWFRGQSDANWSVTSTLDRMYTFADDEERESLNSLLLDEFSRQLTYLENSQFVDLRGDALELLARHHGLPSPMLDWTASPYIAAFFAFAGSIIAGSESVAIWTFNRAEHGLLENDVRIIGEEDFELLRFNRRALHQRGFFTRVSTVRSTVEELFADTLVKFTIPSSEAALALTDLDAMTINSTYLFESVEAAAATAASRISLRRI